MKALLQLFVIPGLFCTLVCGSTLRAQIIISDDFTPNDGTDTSLATHLPEVSPGGEGYVSEGFWGYGVNLTTQDGQDVVKIGADTGAALDFSSVAISDPSISANVSVGNIGNGDSRGVEVGFYSLGNPSGTSSTGDFTGFILTNTGALTLDVDSNPIETVASLIPNFSTSDFYTVSYTIDRSTGGFSNVSVDGTAYDFTTLATPFTTAATAYAGFGVTAPDGSQDGYVNTFLVTPEPSTWALLAGGLALLLAVNRRRLRS